MAETTEINFSHQEIVEMLIRQQGIHEGIWQLSIRFNFAAISAGPSPTEVSPTAIVSVAQIGLHRTDKESNIAVDAGKVNPKAQAKPTKGPK